MTLLKETLINSFLPSLGQFRSNSHVRIPQTVSKLKREFYIRDDVISIGKELLGKWLMTRVNGIVTGGMIAETESYRGAEDKASHAYNNRRTKRTEVLFHKGGIAYVYFCYGMHHLFNVVTHEESTPHAILVRALIPSDGIDEMQKRRTKPELPNLCLGPGNLCQALGIDRTFNGRDLTSSSIWIEDRDLAITEEAILATPRIGIDYAEEDALLPWRFLIKKEILQSRDLFPLASQSQKIYTFSS